MEFQVDPELETLGYDRPRTKLTIVLRDGRAFQGRADTALGNPEQPLSDEALRDKFLTCAERVLSPERARWANDVLTSLEDLPDVRELAEACRP